MSCFLSDSGTILTAISYSFSCLRYKVPVHYVFGSFDRPFVISRTHERRAPFGTMMNPDLLQNWLNFGRTLLIFLILIQCLLGEMKQMWISERYLEDVLKEWPLISYEGFRSPSELIGFCCFYSKSMLNEKRQIRFRTIIWMLSGLKFDWQPPEFVGYDPILLIFPNCTPFFLKVDRAQLIFCNCVDFCAA